jgi:alkanesulfonate monooxygenase SsuD/methylene tetrahydromethanopterin reductase-like flavin-dependent oxidoreductase (luciferase family)
VGDRGRPIEFGVFLDPSTAALEETRRAAERADALGLELVGVQDHPYQARFLDTFALMGDLLARTRRVRVFPDVANLPLRGAAMIAKQAASLDVLSGGRFELGLGAGAFWDAIAAMGGPKRGAGEALAALEEAIVIARRFWSGERSIDFPGEHYAVSGLHPGPVPPHPIEIWLGVTRPKGLALAGRLADGWIPSLAYAPPEEVPGLQRQIDDAAEAAGRDPSAVRRACNVAGLVTDTPSSDLLHGPAAHWVETLTEFALELGLDTFVFWPPEDTLGQLERFASDVAPGVREAVARARGS